MTLSNLSFPRSTSLLLSAALGTMLLFTAACGSSFAPPTDKLSAAESAVRAAQELGAGNNPQAALHVRIAQEEIEKARSLMRDGDNKRADFVLQRAVADAELAVLLGKESKERREADEAAEQVKSLKK